MSLTQDLTDANYIITGYESDCVLVNHEAFFTSLIVTSDKLINPWEVTSVDQLDESNLDDIFKLNPEVVLIGTGETLIQLHPKLIAKFSHQNVGVETMNTSAACRTYGILISEGRRTAAAIIFP